MTEKQPISEEELRKTFFALQKPEDVAVFLGISYPKLTYFLFKLIDSQKYHEFKIPKKAGGSRQITAPHYSLKQHQKKLSRLFQAAYKPKASTHGFVTSRSIVTNAKRHCRRKHLINIDLENFFPSIHFGRVRGMFKAIPYNLPPAVADTLARICCWNHQLPQGAPTSPVISNMLCGKLDSQMFQLCEKNRCLYTRYADDISISTNQPVIPEPIGKVISGEMRETFIVGDEIVRIIETENRFKINQSKVRLQKSTQRQSVTGLITNTKVNVKRRFVRNVRAMLHAWDKFGLSNAQKVFEKNFCTYRLPQKGAPSFAIVLKGKIDFIGMVKKKDDETYRSLLHWYKKLYHRDIEKPAEGGAVDYKHDVFLSHASEDKKSFAHQLAQHLVRKGLDVWYDEFELKIGDSLREKIDHGLRNSKYGIVVLSKAFFQKNWTQKELDGLYAMEGSDGRKRILPLWYKVTKEEVERYSPTLAGRKGLEVFNIDYDKITDEIVKVVKGK